MLAAASCGAIAVAAFHSAVVLMIAMFLMIAAAVSRKSGFRNQNHRGPKRGSEH